MYFQQRDQQILVAIYEYGGVLSRTQIKEMFWLNKSWRAMEIRLSKLQRTGYIAWPEQSQRNQHPIPRSIIWLAPKGILQVAKSQGVEEALPTRLNESQLRKLKKNLHKQGISWVCEPAWFKLGHDLTLVDIRRAFEKAIGSMPNIRTGEWMSDHTFRVNPDRIRYQIVDRGLQKSYTRAIIPDAYFNILDINRQNEGKPYLARFLVELDMATHSNTNFGRFKAAPYAAYIGSKLFTERFGGKTARWLVITTGTTRLRNLISQCQKFAGSKANLFYLALIKDVLSSNPLVAPIWQSPGQLSKLSLMGNGGDHE